MFILKWGGHEKKIIIQTFIVNLNVGLAFASLMETKGTTMLNGLEKFKMYFFFAYLPCLLSN